MDSKITINIVEPGSGPTPAPVVPNTGLFTSGIGGPEATAIGTVLILTIAAIVVAVCYRKQKKSGKVTKLVHLVDSTKAVLKSKKRITAGLSAIALLASAGTLTTLLANAGKSNTNAADGNDSLTLDVSSEDFTIEVGDSPVFAVLPVELTVEEATQAGYTLTAYTDNTDLVSTTNPDNIIPMVTLPEAGGELSALTDNTYGLALVEPESQDDEVYAPLFTDADAPTLITDKDYKATEAGDTTTIYYGFYITPDTPYGTYTGSDIYYNAEENYTTTLTFDGNDSDGGEEMSPVIITAGGSTTLPSNTYTKTGYEFVGWNTNAEGTGDDYADEAEFVAPAGFGHITLYAIWTPIEFNIGYNGNNATAGSMESEKSNGETVILNHTDVVIGDNIELYAPNYKREGYGFAGWSTDSDAWAHLVDGDESDRPVIYGPNQTATVDSHIIEKLDDETDTVTLYAIWVPAKTDTNGNPVMLQSWTGCNALTATSYDLETGKLSVGANSITALTDNRDGEVYAIAKLADGNCWMMENLRLTGTVSLTENNTNNPSANSLPSSMSSFSNDYCDQYGCTFESRKLHVNSVNTSIGGSNIVASYDKNGQKFQWYSYGTYYDWKAATAGNGDYTQTSGNVGGDICPTGWQLPYGGSSTDDQGGGTSGGFYYLNQRMGGDTSSQGSNNWRSFPNNFIYSGYYDDDTRTIITYDGTIKGYYWTSSYGQSTGWPPFQGPYTFSLGRTTSGSGYVSPGTSVHNVSGNESRKEAYPVRCLVAQGQ